LLKLQLDWVSLVNGFSLLTLLDNLALHPSGWGASSFDRN
jgi:hypothetical protein